ncbi:MAG TPA: response regulator [Balneolales bacterium]|nr:response regulator [Balneolales bacterium]
MQNKPLTILMADDDPEDRMLTHLALEKCKFKSDFRHVCDGEELLDYLYQRGKYKDPGTAPKPLFILLDLHMPRKNGIEVLEIIKKDAEVRHIPVVILTSSDRYEDIINTYNLGVNSYIKKQEKFEAFVEELAIIGKYWFDIVRLPKRD